MDTDGTWTLGCDGVPSPTCAWATQKPVGPQAEEQGRGWGCSAALHCLLLVDRAPRRQGVSSPTRDRTRESRGT